MDATIIYVSDELMAIKTVTGGAQSNLERALVMKELRDLMGEWGCRTLDQKMIDDIRIEKIETSKTDQHVVSTLIPARRMRKTMTAILVEMGLVEGAMSLHGSRMIIMARQHQTIVIVMVIVLWIEAGAGERRSAKTGTTEELTDMIEAIEEIDATVGIEVTEATVDGIETETNVKSVNQNG